MNKIRCGAGVFLLAWLALGLLQSQTVRAANRTPDLSREPDAWFRSPEGLRVTTNILSWQTTEGSWPKNLDTSRKPFDGDRSKLNGTFDNSATTGELRFLARAWTCGRDPACERAFYRGLDHVLKAQYPTGGWPQSYPPGKGYPRYITFNDQAMARIMVFLRDVAEAPEFSFVDAGHRRAAQTAFDRGIQCILKCQIRVGGKLTVWCAQHDEVTLEPRGARTYELPSLSGSESAGLLRLLMSLDKPSPEVKAAVRAGAAWFASAAQTGILIQRVDGVRTLVQDPAAPPLWARFYDLENGRPIFSDRDGVKKYDYNEVGRERRNGYAWYGVWGEEVEKGYADWRKRWDE